MGKNKIMVGNGDSLKISHVSDAEIHLGQDNSPLKKCSTCSLNEKEFIIFFIVK